MEVRVKEFLKELEELEIKSGLFISAKYEEDYEEGIVPYVAVVDAMGNELKRIY